MAAVKKLSTADCEQILERARYGRLACFSPSRDECYVVPVSLTFHDGSAYCGSLAGQKVNYLREHPHGVCLQVDEIDDEQNWRSVVMVADYEELKGEERRQEVVVALHRADYSALHYLMESDKVADADELLVLFALRVKKLSGRQERWLWNCGAQSHE